MSDTVSKKTYADEHPEQDPAEGSPEVIDHDLEATEDGSASKPGQGAAKSQKGESQAK